MLRDIRFCVVMILIIIIFSSCKSNSYNFEGNKENMEVIATEIAEGKHEIKENGLVKLPESYKNLADTGEVCLTLFDGKPAVYFWNYRGMLGNSKGYIYILDTIEGDIVDKCSERFNFVKWKEIGEGWYIVSTDD